MKKYCLNQESYYTNIKTNYDKKKKSCGPGDVMRQSEDLKYIQSKLRQH